MYIKLTSDGVYEGQALFIKLTSDGVYSEGLVVALLQLGENGPPLGRRAPLLALLLGE